VFACVKDGGVYVLGFSGSVITSVYWHTSI
jgi:hypothetical protein